MRNLIALAAVLTLCGAGRAAADCDLGPAAPASADPACERAWMEKNVKLNQLQVVGSHNSYHQQIPAEVVRRYAAYDADMVRRTDYVSHLSLTEQLDLGLRHLEIDVWNDPKGGLYADPVGERWLREADPAWPAYDPQGVLRRPGFKVLHVPDVDYRTSCLTYVACLREVRRWSLGHPGHLPIFIHGNAKEPPRKPFPWGGVRPLPFDRAAFDALEAEVLSVFPRIALLTPDDVRKGAATVMEGVREQGWPSLGEARSKVIFVLDGSARQQKVYLGGDPAQAGRLFFSDPHDPNDQAAGYTVVMDAREAPREAPDLVRAGILVRTLGDFEMVEPRGGDASRQRAALASGAQVVSTDFYRVDPRYPSGYRFAPFATGRWVRCNPVNAPARCSSDLLSEGAP